MPYYTQMQKGFGDLAGAFMGGGANRDKAYLDGMNDRYGAEAKRWAGEKYRTDAALNQDRLSALGGLASAFGGSSALLPPGASPGALSNFVRAASSFQPQDIPAMLRGFQQVGAGNTAMSPQQPMLERSMAGSFAAGLPAPKPYAATSSGVVYNAMDGGVDTSNPMAQAGMRALDSESVRDYAAADASRAAAGASSADTMKVLAEIQGTLPQGLSSPMMQYFYKEVGVDPFSGKPQMKIDQNLFANFAQFWSANRQALPQAEQALGVWLHMQQNAPGGGGMPPPTPMKGAPGGQFSMPPPMMPAGGVTDPAGIR